MDFSIKINKHDGPNKRDDGKILKVFLYFLRNILQTTHPPLLRYVICERPPALSKN